MARRITVPVVKIIVSLGLIFFLFHKLGYKNVLSQFIAIDIYWFIAGMVIFIASNLLGSFQWQLLLKARGVDLPLRKIVSYYFTGLFFNNFLVGYIGGDAVRIYDISKATAKNTEAISTVFLDRFIGFTMLTTLALGAAIYYINFFTSNKILFTIILIFIFWLVIIMFLFNIQLMNKISWLIKMILPDNIKTTIKNIYLGINEFKNHRGILLKVLLISIIIQSLRILVHYTAARSFGVKINVIYFVIFVPIIALLASLPISIGGIGVRETSGAALFSQIWPVQADIVAFEFLAFLIGIIAALPGGIVFMLRKEIKKPITEGGYSS